MNKSILAYIVGFIVIILVILVFSLYPRSSKPKTTVTTMATTVITTISSNTASTSTTTVLPATTMNYGECISTNGRWPILNGNFSLGTFTGWNVSGPGFGKAPINITYANAHGSYYGSPWNGLSGNVVFAAATYQTGLAVQEGNITSKPFEVIEPYLNFKIISPQSNLFYIEILKSGKPVIVAHYNTYAANNNSQPQSTFQNATITLGRYPCQNVSVRIVSGFTGTSTTNYIAVSDFYMSNVPIQAAGIVVNQTFLT